MRKKDIYVRNLVKELLVIHDFNVRFTSRVKSGIIRMEDRDPAGPQSAAQWKEDGEDLVSVM